MGKFQSKHGEKLHLVSFFFLLLLLEMKYLKCLITTANCHLIIWAASKPRQSPEGKTDAVIANLYMNLLFIYLFIF